MTAASGTLLLGAAAFVTSVALTWSVRTWAWRSQLLDIPNKRSSHNRIVPRGGGLAIALVVCVGAVGALWAGMLEARAATAIVPSGALIALVGYVDDRSGLKPSVRLTVHVAAVVWLMWWYGGLPEVGIFWVDAVPAVRNIIAGLALVWFINLFNFMDGIDALAASEALFVMALIAFLIWLRGGYPQAIVPLLLGASAGFLLWNWPQASIFMGDVGSGFLGFMLGAVVVDACARHGLSPIPLVIGAGVFIMDATVTLVRRFLRRERVSQSHRSHAYQRLAIRWASHRKVVFVVLALNLLWLFPLALLAALRPQHAPWLLPAALVPLAVAALCLGAGKPH